MGGRIGLVNSVLNNLSIYHISFYKALVHVWRDLISTQQNFIWGGLYSKRKIHWVSWKKMCRPKDYGDLEIKDIELFNQH